jgi:hypothetical protein
MARDSHVDKTNENLLHIVRKLGRLIPENCIGVQLQKIRPNEFYTSATPLIMG